MNNNEKYYYVTISSSDNATPKRSWLEKHQYIINFVLALATLFLSFTTSIISITVATEYNEIQVFENMPNFYYEYSTYKSTEKYDFLAISLKNNGGIIKNGFCEIKDIVTIYSSSDNYKFSLSANYNAIQNEFAISFDYDSITKSFSYCQNENSFPIKYLCDSFNTYFQENNLPYNCYTETYIKIIYTDYRNKNHEEFYRLINNQLESINKNLYDNIYLYDEFYYFENILNIDELLSLYFPELLK